MKIGTITDNVKNLLQLPELLWLYYIPTSWELQEVFQSSLDFSKLHKKEVDFMYNSTNVSENIKFYAKSKKVAIGVMLSDCELSKNTLSSMQSGGYLPRTETLAKIADYLDCSVDYLLGRTDNPEVNK